MQLDRGGFHSEISPIHLEKVRSQVFSVDLSIEEPLILLLVVAEAGSACCAAVLPTPQ